MKYTLLAFLLMATCAAPAPAQMPPNMDAQPYEMVELIPVVKGGVDAIVYFNGTTYGNTAEEIIHVDVPGVGIVTVQMMRSFNETASDTSDTATVIGVPYGYRAEPLTVTVPEGGREIIYILPDLLG